MTGKILWRAATASHDWGDGACVTELLERARTLGLVGSVSWQQPDWYSDVKKIPAADPEGPLADLLAAARPVDGLTYFEIGGDDPAPWSLAVTRCPFDATQAFVQGQNTVSLYFESAPDRVTSELFRGAFQSLHTPANADWAVLHPAEHFEEFSDRRYDMPVTISTMFRGIFWANFLGPGHLQEFAAEKITDFGDAWEVHREGSDDLWLLSPRDFAAATARPAEEEYLQATKIFRRALRPDSKWSL